MRSPTFPDVHHRPRRWTSRGSRVTSCERAGRRPSADIGICTICSEARVAVLAPARQRDHRPPGGRRVVDLIRGLAADTGPRQPGARPRADRRRRPRSRRGPDPGRGQVPAHRGAGGAGAGRGDGSSGRTARRSWWRRREALPGRFTWDFIGQLQSRKVRDLVPRVRYIHSVASRLGAGAARRATGRRPPRSGRGQRRRRGGQERDRSRRSWRRFWSAARSRSWA